MNIQPLLKLPFRLARAAARAAKSLAVSPTAHAPQPTIPEPPAPPPPPAPVERAPIGVRVEQTPNPDARKFVCSVIVVHKGSLVFNDRTGTDEVPFAKGLFALEGVRTVFATKDFVTVTREPDGPGWPTLMPQIEHVLSTTVGA